MTATFLLPSTPCCGAPVFWEEAELKLPCVAGEYALPIPPGAPESFVAAVQDLLREHNLAEHDVDTGMHFWGVYGLMEAPGAVGRHGPGFPGPVRTPVRCQCLGVPFQGVPRRQCGLAADTVTSHDRWRTCRPCRVYCKILLPLDNGMHQEHRAPLTVHRGRFN